VRDVLVVVDVLDDFEHEDGDRLLASFRARLPGLRDALAGARGGGIPVVYVNDVHGRWSADRAAIVRRALDGKGGADVALVAPHRDEPLLLKPRYSAFDHTPLDLVLADLGAERLLLAGATTEGCVVQTGIDARELGFKVTIVTSACATIDEATEQVALRYAEEVAGICLAEDLARAVPARNPVYR
jgi:nicotinamidase-related amidase